MARNYGDVTAEFRALLTGCGVYDLRGRTKVVLTGSDRVRWLNGMTTNNVRDLAVGHGVYAFLLNPQGHIQADLYSFQRGEHILVDLDGQLREKVLGLFDHYIIADDVEVADISSKLVALGLSGASIGGCAEARGYRCAGFGASATGRSRSGRGLASPCFAAEKKLRPHGKSG